MHKKPRYYLIGILLTLTLLPGTIRSQSSSENYSLPDGEFVGGGRTQSSDFYRITGTITGSTVGTGSSGSYTITGGLLGNALSLFAVNFSATALDTLTANDSALTLEYIGGTGEATAVIYARLGGDTLFEAQSMTPAGVNTLQYPLASDDLGARGLEYYVEVTRGITRTLGSSNNPRIAIIGLNNTGGQSPTATLDQQYSLIGIPLSVGGDNSVGAVFSDDLGSAYKTMWRLGRWNSSLGEVIEFPNAEAVLPGRGYWLITRGRRTFGAGGFSVRPSIERDGIDYYPIPLDSGWNMIANPFDFCVDWREIVFEDFSGPVPRDTSLLEDALYAFSQSGFEEVNILQRWRGALVFIKQPGITALFPYRATTCLPASRPAARPSPHTADSWMLQLSLLADGKSDAGNIAGIDPQASVTADQFDRSKPPPPPDFPWLAFEAPGIDDRLMRADYRHEIDTATVWEVHFAAGSERILSIDGVTEVPEYLDLSIVLDIGTVVNLRDSAHIALADDVRSARLIIGDPDYVNRTVQSVLPDDFSLSQNFPNPFNPSTAIRFDLPVPTHVSLAIYNILGQEVARLADGPLPAGYHTVDWNGQTRGGGTAASGVYFYRLTADTFTESRKMILLK